MPTQEDHMALVERVVAALNAPGDDPAPLRALGSDDDAWERGGLLTLWRLRKDGFVFSSAGALAPRADKTFGCVRFHRRGAPADMKSVFLLLAARDGRPRVDGVEGEVPVALAWLRGWIVAGQRVESLPSDPEGEAFAASLAAVAHGSRGEWLATRLGADLVETARADTLLFEGPATVLGVHALPIVGRMFVGIGVGYDELWLVLERNARSLRLRFVGLMAVPSMTSLVSGARAIVRDEAQPDGDLFIERLADASRAAPPIDRSAEAEGAHFREELQLRLGAAFARAMPADEVVADALKDALQSSEGKGKSMGELVTAVLERLASRASEPR